MTNTSFPPDVNTRPIAWATNLLRHLVMLAVLWIGVCLVISAILWIMEISMIVIPATLVLVVFGLIRFYK